MASELKQKTVKGLAWNSIQNFANHGIQFILMLFMARLLGPKEYGILGLTSVFLAISATFINSGFVSALIRKKDTTNDDYDTVFVLSTEQVKKYLTRTSDRQFSASAYAIKARKVFRGADGYYNWWTRSNHVESGSFWKDQIDIVRKYGEIAYTKPTDADCGILPAVWIDISAYMNL